MDDFLKESDFVVSGTEKQKLELLPRHRLFLGKSSRAVPLFPFVSVKEPFPEGCNDYDIDIFRMIYHSHCKSIIYAIMELQFERIAFLLMQFWRPDEFDYTKHLEVKTLMKDQMMSLCQLKSVQEFILYVDMHFYQNIAKLLMPNLIQMIPDALRMAIGDLARDLEGWMLNAIDGYPTMFSNVKMTSVGALCRSLRKYCAVSLLAYQIRPILYNRDTLNLMIQDYDKVTHDDIMDEIFTRFPCDMTIMQHFTHSFRMALQEPTSLDSFVYWYKDLVAAVLLPYKDQASFSDLCRQFVLRWNQYSSMVLRELCVTEAQRYPDFCLVFTFGTDYILCLVEELVGEQLKLPPIAVMTEDKCDLNTFVQENSNLRWPPHCLKGHFRSEESPEMPVPGNQPASE